MTLVWPKPECANVPSCRIYFIGGASALYQWQAGYSVPLKGDPCKDTAECQSKGSLTHWSAAASFPERQGYPVCKSKSLSLFLLQLHLGKETG